jgi:Asp-tRNA(Asn)/Glu-tRNA(Gln) amidotransferase A subunit family amidase
VGATEAGNCFIGFVMHHAPGPMLAVQPTVELAKRNSRQRIDPLIEESPELRERIKPARSRDAGNTMLSKEFAGGILIMTGANSAVGLRSTPARYLFLDEVDAYPASADLAWRNGVWVANGNLAIRHMGVPTVTVPMGTMEDTGMPMGLTFAGRGWDDLRLLQLAVAFEGKGRYRMAPPLP